MSVETHNTIDSDFWYYEIGINCIPFDSKNETTQITWSTWQGQPLPDGIYQTWKKTGLFDKGVAVIAGKIWSGKYEGKYLACIDIDNKKGIQEFLLHFGEIDNLEKLSQKTIVEQHKDDLNKTHIYFIVEEPLGKKSGLGGIKKPHQDDDTQIPAMEVKSDGKHGLMIVSPSIHKNDYPYEIIGTKEPTILNKEQSKELEIAINKIYDKYYIKRDLKDNKAQISELFEDDFIVYEGNNRHLQVLRFCESSYVRSNLSLTFDELLARAISWNEKHCKDPLETSEIKKLVKQAMLWVSNDKNKSKVVQIQDEVKKSRENYEDSDYQNLFEKIPGRKFAEYIINIAKKTIKREDSLIRLILYAGLSAYTKDPLNLGIVAPTSEGKTYAVSEVMKFFPRQDIWMLGNMSPKVLIRDRGILVDEDNQPIQEEIQELNKKIRKEEDKDRKSELEEQRKLLYEHSKMLIDLSNRALVFLEPPHADTWTILKPILSHDTFEIEHPYVYKADKSLEVKHVVTRGWPVCIFCSAKDDSSWSMWPEIQSRFFIASPNMIKQKYQDSNILIAQKKGLPALVQEQLIVSNEDLKVTMECVSILKKQLLMNHDNTVWIPYGSILSQSLPSEKGPDVRITNRIFSLLNLITKINATNRPKLVFGSETLAVSLLSDLEEVLKLTHNLNGIPSYKIEFFTNIFIPLFLSKESPLEKDDILEDKIAVYTNELADFLIEKSGKTLTTDAIKKTYLTELKNNGLIDDFQSKVDKRKNGYYPIIDVKQFSNKSREKNEKYTNLSQDDNNLQFFKLKLSNNYNNVGENWLNIEIIDLMKYGIGRTNIFKLLDEANNQVCICQFIVKYNIFTDLNRYFQSDENCIYSSKVFGKMIKM